MFTTNTYNSNKPKIVLSDEIDSYSIDIYLGDDADLIKKSTTFYDTSDDINVFSGVVNTQREFAHALQPYLLDVIYNNKGIQMYVRDFIECNEATGFRREDYWIKIFLSNNKHNNKYIVGILVSRKANLLFPINYLYNIVRYTIINYPEVETYGVSVPMVTEDRTVQPWVYY